MRDLLMRLPLLGWVLFAATLQLAALVQFMHTTPVDSVDAIRIAMQLSTIVFMMLIAAAVIVRTRPSGKARGGTPHFGFGRHFPDMVLRHSRDAIWLCR
jgi:hypothetical protein